LTGDGRTRGDRSIDTIDIGTTIERRRRPRPFTAAAAEVAFATARANRGGDLSWGAFLDALALVASAAGRTVGDVALRVREVKRPLASSAGRAPTRVPRVTYVPEPPRSRASIDISAAADGFDTDAFARGCDDAYAQIAPSATTHRPRLEGLEGLEEGLEEEARQKPHHSRDDERVFRTETSDFDGGRPVSPPVVGSGAGAFFASLETVSRVSEETSGAHPSPRFPGLASTWQNRTTANPKLDLGTLGTSLVASLRASEYYRRSRG
jgi:hypothetical protein